MTKPGGCGSTSGTRINSWPQATTSLPMLRISRIVGERAAVADEDREELAEQAVEAVDAPVSAGDRIRRRVAVDERHNVGREKVTRSLDTLGLVFRVVLEKLPGQRLGIGDEIGGCDRLTGSDKRSDERLDRTA